MTGPWPMLMTLEVSGDQHGFKRAAVHAAAVFLSRKVNRAGWKRFANSPVPSGGQDFVRLVSKKYGVSVRVVAQYVMLPSTGEPRMIMRIDVAGYK